MGGVDESRLMLSLGFRGTSSEEQVSLVWHYELCSNKANGLAGTGEKGPKVAARVLDGLLPI